MTRAFEEIELPEPQPAENHGDETLARKKRENDTVHYDPREKKGHIHDGLACPFVFVEPQIEDENGQYYWRPKGPKKAVYADDQCVFERQFESIFAKQRPKVGKPDPLAGKNRAGDPVILEHHNQPRHRDITKDEQAYDRRDHQDIERKQLG